MKEQVIDSSEITGFLDEGTDFKGEMRFNGTMRIDGRFEGSIHSKSSLIVGETAVIKADIIEVGAISINGAIEGKVVASDRIEIHENGRMIGSIQTPSLIIDDGAVLQGSCGMEKKTVQKQVPETKKDEKA